jgi:hypothetical protein
MPVYKVAVEWSVFSEVEVEASSMEEAIMEVESNDSILPVEGSYIDGSLTINHEMTNFFNKKHFS